MKGYLRAKTDWTAAAPRQTTQPPANGIVWP